MRTLINFYLRSVFCWQGGVGSVGIAGIAFSVLLFSSDRECGCVHVPDENPLILKFLQPFREDFGCDTMKGIPQFGKPAGIFFAFVELKDDQQRPFLCQIFHGLVNRARILHGMYLETLDYLYLVNFDI